jgi:hypothetical protein
MASPVGGGRRPASRINRHNPTAALTAALGSSGISHCLKYSSGLTHHPLGNGSAAAAAGAAAAAAPPPPTALELGGRRHFAPMAKDPPRQQLPAGEAHEQQPASPVDQHQGHGKRPVSRALLTRVGDAINQNYSEDGGRFARVPQPERMKSGVIAAGATSTKLGRSAAHPTERDPPARAAAAMPLRQLPPFALDVTSARPQPQRTGAPRPPAPAPAPGQRADGHRESPGLATPRHQLEAGVSSREAGGRAEQGRPLPLRDMRKLGSL